MSNGKRDTGVSLSSPRSVIWAAIAVCHVCSKHTALKLKKFKNSYVKLNWGARTGCLTKEGKNIIFSFFCQTVKSLKKFFTGNATAGLIDTCRRINLLTLGSPSLTLCILDLTKGTKIFIFSSFCQMPEVRSLCTAWWR